MKFGCMKRSPTIQVNIELPTTGPQQVHPRVAELACKIENALAYLDEFGQGGDESQEALDFLELVHKAFQVCTAEHMLKVSFYETIESVLSKWRPEVVQSKEPHDGQA